MTQLGYLSHFVVIHTDVSVSKECKINLAKMWDCSLCSGEPQSKPCPGLCANVMKGCLADWAEVDQQWNAVIARCYTIDDVIREPRHLASFARIGARHRRDMDLRGINERADNYGKVLNSLMNSFSERLSALRGWFTGLPTAFCSDSGLVAADGETLDVMRNDLRLGMLAFRLQNALHGQNYTNYEIEGSATTIDDEDY
ncbi:hypothetical protein OSTOST_18846, partial [Ostertagia ostertagi]